MTSTPVKTLLRLAGACLALALLGVQAPAMAAPGEDPVILNQPVQHLSLPLNNAAKSQGLDAQDDIPAYLKAKVARYEAKAFSEQNAGIATDSDVVTRANAQGLRKTCVQEVGSTTTATGASNAFNRYGPGAQAQVVVLRGDLINVCN
ncbi:MAG: hypothetical protein EOO33_03145 [Comamonadaceae bacterium]|nr:MAG: hypothetical protein EOO33_03145 [Comamonadaceae bacterium]